MCTIGGHGFTAAMKQKRSHLHMKFQAQKHSARNNWRIRRLSIVMRDFIAKISNGKPNEIANGENQTRQFTRTAGMRGKMTRACKTVGADNSQDVHFKGNKELGSRHWLSKRFSCKEPEEYGPNYGKTAQSPSAPPHCVNCLVSQARTLIILQNKCFEFPHVFPRVIASKNIR